jgi:hypothetical protein
MARSQRALKRIWRDARPFNRRARWYEGTIGDTGSLTIRIELSDEHHLINRFFTTTAMADKWTERFIELCNARPHPVDAHDPSPVHTVDLELHDAQEEGK